MLEFMMAQEHYFRFVVRCLLAGAFGIVGLPQLVNAQVLPGPADINRIGPIQKQMIPEMFQVEDMESQSLLPLSAPPDGAKDIFFVLKAISIEGSTVYTAEELAETHSAFIGKKISLDKIWSIAAEITERYRADGYFLSRAYVPAQEADGHFIIRVAEGYIKEVQIDPKIAEAHLVQDIISTITSERPSRLKTLERQHLLLRDIPGLDHLQGTLTPLGSNFEGGVRLVFSSRANYEAPKRGFLNIDNFGSRFLGPHNLTAGWEGVLLPYQTTSLTGALSIPADELAAINIAHTVAFKPYLKLEASAGYTRTEPGYTLEPQKIKGSAVNTGLALNYQAIRQRRENLQLKLALDARNSNSTILNTTLSKDKIRAARVSAIYDRTDAWNGYNVVDATLSRGIDGLGSSKADALNLSRNGAKPDFTKIEAQYKRIQAITSNWVGLLSISGQQSSGSLYSSEEFGYGGQALGRAYDQSEISGDDGFAAGIETRYHGLEPLVGVRMQPYGFYDIGKVWNRNSGQTESVSGSSAGIGMRMVHDNGMSGTIQMAVPLTKSADTPLYGGSGATPRIGLQFGYQF